MKFVRALITNFHITSLIQKVDKNMNLLGIAIVLVSRYGGHKWHRILVLRIGCTISFSSQYRFLASKVG